MPADKAAVVADVLVEGDLMGHTTHGLALLGPYLREIESGTMRSRASRRWSESAAALTWDGRRLPGPWLVLQAMEAATRWRAGGHRHRGHPAQPPHRQPGQLPPARGRAGPGAAAGLSDPNSASVAPFGGLDPVFTPNPVSAGFPTGGLPVSVDISTSTTTNGLTNRLHAQGGKLPAPWVLDGHGKPSNDPAVLFTEPKGTILPLGGLDSGHKGYGCRCWSRRSPAAWPATAAPTRRRAGARRCSCRCWTRGFRRPRRLRAATGRSRAPVQGVAPRRPGRPVRMPGERGFQLSMEQRDKGVALHESILPMLEPWAEKFGVALPG
jgi:LDH2 family malate/lactate/ureidoglycolate dehydrogenase